MMPMGSIAVEHSNNHPKINGLSSVRSSQNWEREDDEKMVFELIKVLFYFLKLGDNTQSCGGKGRMSVFNIKNDTGDQFREAKFTKTWGMYYTTCY